MDVVKISDGLGNQMFQYAFARKLQMNTGVRVFLDTRFINNEDVIIRNEDDYRIRKNDFRKYKLDKLQIELPCAGPNILRHWNYLSEVGAVQQGIYTLSKMGLWPWHYCDENLTDIQMTSYFPTYYKGYFFHLKYYDDIRKILQREFAPKKKIGIPLALKKALKSGNTVGIHIRRGDFLRLNRDISQKGYYSNALNIVSKKIGQCIYLVFSDDIEWVKKNIKIDGEVIYVSDMEFQDYEELTIMKHCKHNIIANSTFSYWAAYLNENQNKVVICPKHWKTDIIPKDWISI